MERALEQCDSLPHTGVQQECVVVPPHSNGFRNPTDFATRVLLLVRAETCYSGPMACMCGSGLLLFFAIQLISLLIDFLQNIPPPPHTHTTSPLQVSTMLGSLLARTFTVCDREWGGGSVGSNRVCR